MIRIMVHADYTVKRRLQRTPRRYTVKRVLGGVFKTEGGTNRKHGVLLDAVLGGEGQLCATFVARVGIRKLSLRASLPKTFAPPLSTRGIMPETLMSHEDHNPAPATSSPSAAVPVAPVVGLVNAQPAKVKTPGSSRRGKQYKCGNCGELGHNQYVYLCSLWRLLLLLLLRLVRGNTRLAVLFLWVKFWF